MANKSILSVGQHGVPENKKPLLSPTHIVWVEIGADRDEYNLDIDFRFGDSLTASSDISRILKSAASGAPFPQLRKKRERMTLNVPNCSYIVFRLSNDLDWQFSHDRAPISLSDKANALGAKHFENANRVLSDGTLAAGAADDCMVACISCDGAALKGKTGFSAPLNLHVDLIDRDRNGDIVGRLPIVIDPDVKEPGGTEP